MTPEFYTYGIEKEICQEIQEWSQGIVEKANPYFNNLPSCPYARKAWREDKISFLFKKDGGFQDLYTAISSFNDELDIVMLVDLAFEKDSEAFHEYLENLNDVISEGMFIDKDIWLMGFHPSDEENDYIDDSTFMNAVEKEYAIIFIQRLSKLQESADMLVEKGYYDQYRKEYDADAIFQKREKFYRRLKDGDET
jgi:hypothetical protein|tara:strand:- start:2186 stop:2770 length:585 start_codon:yes stop_codon:yes gene_type:complete